MTGIGRTSNRTRIIFLVDLSYFFPIDNHVQNRFRAYIAIICYSEVIFFVLRIYTFTVHSTHHSISIHFYKIIFMNIFPLVVYYGKMSKHEIIRVRIPILRRVFELFRIKILIHRNIFFWETVFRTIKMKNKN